MGKIFLFATAGALLAAPGVSLAQSAQPPAASAGSTQLQEIVVTAQRRTENLQDVPIAATAISGGQLEAKAVTNLDTIQFASPALTITTTGLTESVNIRGIGLASGSPQVAAGVAVYWDGLFQPPIVQMSTFYDIANVEVLRGPQGTLVGSNSTGGAMFITTQNPRLSGNDGYVEGAIGNYSSKEAQGALNIPISDTLAIRIAGLMREHDGYWKDLGPYNNHPEALREHDGRLGVLWKPTDAFQALAKVDFINRYNGGFGYKPVATTTWAPFTLPGQRDVAYNYPSNVREDGKIYSLELRYETPAGITLRSLTGYQDKNVTLQYDNDATLAGNLSTDQFVRERQKSEEINIISPTTGRLNWILGGYFQNNFINVDLTSLNAGFPTHVLQTQDKTTTGVFAQAGFKITSQLELQAGLRHSTFKGTGAGAVTIGAGIPGFPETGLPVADLAGEHSDGMTTGKVALNWKPDDLNLIYAFVARGYKPGGFNSSTSEFGPESVWDYEIGWKSTLLDGHLRTQIGGFYNQYHGFQFNLVDTTTGQSGVANLPDATIKGIEGQAQARFGGLALDGSFAYVDSQLGKLTFVNTEALPPGTLGPQCAAGVPSSPPACFDYAPFVTSSNGGPNLYAPKWTYNVGAQYDFALPQDLTLTPRVNVSYVGPQWSNFLYNPVTDLLAAHTLVSALLTLTNGTWSVEAFGNNLTNAYYIAGQTNNNNFYGPPREFGMRVRTRF